MAKSQERKPSHKTAYFDNMAADWALISALLGGTRRMREAGKEYLPRHDSETEESYSRRLMATTLLNVFDTTTQQITGQAFANPVSADDLPADLEFIASNIDGKGTSLSDFGRRIFDCALKRAEAYVFIDMEQPGEDERTRREQLAANRQPYAVFIHPSQMLAYQSEMIGGREVTTYARWVHEVVEPDGNFGEITRTFVTEWSRTKWSRWEKPKGDDAAWLKEGPYPHGFKIGGDAAVPMAHLAFVDPGDDGLRRPPLMDLADKNVEHWQSSSDQRNILTFSRFPMLFLAGVSKEGLPTVGDKVALGPRQIINSSDSGAKGQYLEPSGSAIQAGERDLENLKKEMALLAAQPFMSRPGGITATQTALEEGKSSTLVEHWVQRTAAALSRVIRFMGAWKQADVQVGVVIKPEFAAMTAAAEKVKALIEARRNGDISRKQFWAEMKAVDFVSDAFDFDTNESDLIAEGEGGFENDAA